ncbi:MAG: hypothetical protein IPM29_28605 [Planctomycetes bacterium]|nr:hypothetical protein [Planctomycetota bacterium]
MTLPPELERRFAGRTLGVATMHGKERAIGPAFTARLPLAGVVAIADLDTDRFGAFSGEVVRRLAPPAAAEAKARAGARLAGLDLAIASEGSFGPYPPAPLLACDEEWLVLVDLRDDLVLRHCQVTLDAVWGGRACASLADVEAFAARAGFPDHRLVLRPAERWREGDPQHKGLGTRDELRAAATALLERHGSAWVEVDLRAMANPTRMRAIGAAAAGFAAELATLCPACGAHGFAIAAAVPGLPCADCGEPTAGVLHHERRCWRCAHGVAEPRADGLTAADPQHCEWCNP